MILSSIVILFSVVLLSTIITLGILFFFRKKRSPLPFKQLNAATRFQLAFDSSPIGTALLSLQGNCLEANKALGCLLGYSKRELLGINFKEIVHAEDLTKDLSLVKKLERGKASFCQLEQRFIKKDGQNTWILLTLSVIRGNHNEPLCYMAQIQDINDKIKAENELSYKAYYDTLTGLFNRNQLEHSLQSSISIALRHQKKFAVFFIDLDHFKEINDRLGHDTGDQLLKVVGERLKNNIRQTDIAGRLGGDEFIIVLNGVSTAETAAIFAEKMINILIEPIKIKEHELFITTSIGISFYPSDGRDFNSLIKSADLALYKAKENGRNNYKFCTPELNNEIKEKTSFKNALQVALDNHEFYLVYLPKMNLERHTITGFETLLRWKTEKYGEVSPSKIISQADEMGIISQLSEWIIQTSVEQTKIWQQYGLSQPIKIAINISAKHYVENDFLPNILQILTQARVSPDYLQLEINENLVMRDPEYSLKIIRELKQNGIQVVIDNFGTGYSSLNYLRQFGVDYIKIDRQFTKNLNGDDQRVLFLAAITDLAKNLNIKTLAEGVESKEQIELLASIGCDEVQGFYISPPIVANDVPRFLEKQAVNSIGAMQG